MIGLDDVEGFFAQEERDSDPFDGYPRAVSNRLQRNASANAKWAALTQAAPAEWYADAPAKRTWLLRDTRHAKARGVLPLGKVGQVIASGGVGKTMVVCQFAIAVATGSLWLGAFSVASPGRVLLVLGEEDADEARRRLYRASRADGGPPPAPDSIVVLPLAGVAAPMLDTDKQGNATDTDFLVWLREYVLAGDFRLVVIDPLSRFAGRDAEKDNAAATRFMQACESLASPATSVLVVHHTNQLSRSGGTVDATAGRGVTGLVDGARWQCALTVERLKFGSPEAEERLGEIVTFAVTKSNYAAKPEPILLRRDRDNGGALLPVGAEDIGAIDAARTNGSAHVAERGARQAAREEADAARRKSKALDDETVALRVVRESPGLNTGDLVAAIKREARCAEGRASDALKSLRPFLDVQPGPARSSLHYPPKPSTVLPVHLKATS